MSIPREAEGGTYVFLAQQWEPGGQPAYPGGAAIYPSSATPVEVRPYVDAEEFWGSFEPWPEEDADHSDGAQRGEFFLDLGDGRSLPLYPFIASMTCSRCAAVETYFIDDWDQRRNLARMKSFERAHTINESKVPDALADSEYTGKNDSVLAQQQVKQGLLGVPPGRRLCRVDRL